MDEHKVKRIYHPPVIPATDLFNGGKKHRVAAYTRVSTASDEQINSAKVQYRYHTHYRQHSISDQERSIVAEDGNEHPDKREVLWRRRLQKTYIADHISHESQINNGELPSYFVENGHPGIVPKRSSWRYRIGCSIRIETVLPSLCTPIRSSVLTVDIPMGGNIGIPPPITIRCGNATTSTYTTAAAKHPICMKFF